MFSSRDAFENDFCPVRDELLGEMYRASENGLPQLVESVSSDVRAMLALFCYRRSHLHSLALAIAASCNERDLIQFGGRVGSTLYALSREAPAARPVPRILRQPQADHAVDQAAVALRAFEDDSTTKPSPRPDPALQPPIMPRQLICGNSGAVPPADARAFGYSPGMQVRHRLVAAAPRWATSAAPRSRIVRSRPLSALQRSPSQRMPDSRR